MPTPQGEEAARRWEVTKRVHPIRRLTMQLVGGWPDYGTQQIPFAERQIARHVKPLLDALEEWHTSQVRYEQVLGLKKHLCHGDTCRLLAEWRAKL